jgi:hypothetical protein
MGPRLLREEHISRKDSPERQTLVKGSNFTLAIN